MAKKINLMPYVGKQNDLIIHGCESIQDYWFILFNGVPYSISYDKKSGLHRTEALAKVALKKHIEAQFCQGHYWHKGSGNTFEQAGGWTRNNGNVSISRREFKQMAIELTEWLLTEKIFEIKQLLK